MRWWLQLWPSSFNVSLDWLLNVFCVKVMISSIEKIQQATLKEFSNKPLHRRATIVVWNKSFRRGLLWAHKYLDFLKSGTFFLEMHFRTFFNLESWILNPESWIPNLEPNSIYSNGWGHGIFRSIGEIANWLIKKNVEFQGVIKGALFSALKPSNGVNKILWSF